MRDFNSRIYQFKVDGKEYECRYPSVDEVEGYQKLAESGELAKEMKPTYKWLSRLGLKEADVKKLEQPIVQAIVEDLLDLVTAKKK